MNTSRYRRSLRKKVGVSHNQNKSSITQIIATAGSYKNQVKKLQKNNKALASALDEIRLESAEYLRLLQEYANENTQVIKARNKLKVMAEAIQVWMKDMEEVLEILNLKPVDVLKCFAFKDLRCPVKVPDVDPIDEDDHTSFSLPRLSISPIHSQENRIPIPEDSRTEPVAKIVEKCNRIDSSSFKTTLKTSIKTPPLLSLLLSLKRISPVGPSLPSKIPVKKLIEKKVRRQTVAISPSSEITPLDDHTNKTLSLDHTPSPPEITSKSFLKQAEASDNHRKTFVIKHSEPAVNRRGTFVVPGTFYQETPKKENVIGITKTITEETNTNTETTPQKTLKRKTFVVLASSPPKKANMKTSVAPATSPQKTEKSKAVVMPSPKKIAKRKTFMVPNTTSSQVAKDDATKNIPKTSMHVLVQNETINASVDMELTEVVPNSIFVFSEPPDTTNLFLDKGTTADSSKVLVKKKDIELPTTSSIKQVCANNIANENKENPADSLSNFSDDDIQPTFSVPTNLFHSRRSLKPNRRGPFVFTHPPKKESKQRQSCQKRKTICEKNSDALKNLDSEPSRTCSDYENTEVIPEENPTMSIEKTCENVSKDEFKSKKRASFSRRRSVLPKLKLRSSRKSFSCNKSVEKENCPSLETDLLQSVTDLLPSETTQKKRTFSGVSERRSKKSGTTSTKDNFNLDDCLINETPAFLKKISPGSVDVQSEAMSHMCSNSAGFTTEINSSDKDETKVYNITSLTECNKKNAPIVNIPSNNINTIQNLEVLTPLHGDSISSTISSKLDKSEKMHSEPDKQTFIGKQQKPATINSKSDESSSINSLSENLTIKSKPASKNIKTDEVVIVCSRPDKNAITVSKLGAISSEQHQPEIIYKKHRKTAAVNVKLDKPATISSKPKKSATTNSNFDKPDKPSTISSSPDKLKIISSKPENFKSDGVTKNTTNNTKNLSVDKNEPSSSKVIGTLDVKSTETVEPIFIIPFKEIKSSKARPKNSKEIIPDKILHDFKEPLQVKPKSKKRDTKEVKEDLVVLPESRPLALHFSSRNGEDMPSEDNPKYRLIESNNEDKKFQTGKKLKLSCSEQKVPKSTQNSKSIPVDTLCELIEPQTKQSTKRKKVKSAEEIDCILPDMQLSGTSKGNQNIGLIESQNQDEKLQAGNKPKSSKKNAPKCKQSSKSIPVDTSCEKPHIKQSTKRKKPEQEVDCKLLDSQSSGAYEGNDATSPELSTKLKRSRGRPKSSKPKQSAPKVVLEESNEPNSKIRKETADFTEENNPVCIPSSSAETENVIRPRRNRTAKSLKEPKLNMKMRR